MVATFEGDGKTINAVAISVGPNSEAKDYTISKFLCVYAKDRWLRIPEEKDENDVSPRISGFNEF